MTGRTNKYNMNLEHILGEVQLKISDSNMSVVSLNIYKRGMIMVFWLCHVTANWFMFDTRITIRNLSTVPPFQSITQGLSPNRLCSLDWIKTWVTILQFFYIILNRRFFPINVYQKSLCFLANDFCLIMCLIYLI